MDAMLTTLVTRDDPAPLAPACKTGNEFDGNLGLRISAIFVILVGSLFGALFPVIVRNDPNNPGKRRCQVSPWLFFIAKFFGSGVILATAFIHLLAPANEALTNPCLTGPISEYSWVEAIMLMTIIVLFFVELMVMRFARFGDDYDEVMEPEANGYANKEQGSGSGSGDNEHLGHSREHPSDAGTNMVNGSHSTQIENYSAQLTSVFILEFGIIFHSIFVGLTLAVAGEEFKTLYVVLVFHQTFEGLGLGARLATLPWPESKKWTPYLLGLGYGVTTPIAIAIGLGVRKTYPPEGRTTLIVNGIFDSISAGILIYTGLVELLAHEFMFSTSMRKAPLRVVLSAFGLLCMGAALMALLGKWA